MLKKIGLFIFAIVLVSSVSLAKVPGTGQVDVPVAGASYTNLSKGATLGAIARIGQNTFKCVTNVSTYPAFQGEPAYLDPSSSDGYSVNGYVSTTQFPLFEGIWYCDKTGNVTIEANSAGSTGVAGGGVGWIQIGGIANALVSGEGTDITAWDYLGPVGPKSKTTTVTTATSYLARNGAGNTAAGNALYYPRCVDAKSNTLDGRNAFYKIYLGNRAAF